MVQGKVRIHLLETAVLFLQFLHTAQLLAVHPGILLLPSVKGGLVDTQLPADVRSAFTRFMLLDRRNDLALADSCLFHCTVLSYEFSRFRQSEFSGGLHRREKRIYEADGFRMAAKWKIKKAIFQG